ncbi:MAG: DUF692 domain-containing protein [Rhodospirillaceae bacterium]|nr:DUF692 domain-containing protein [Rhodospirillaceae bacterium]
MSTFAAGAADTAWVEIHSENFFALGGPRLAQLEDVRSHYAISCHGVGLSLGSAQGVDPDHLATLRGLVDRFEPALVSEHLSFSVVDDIYVNDLLPLPYTEEALEVVVRNVGHTQDALGRQILMENPSSYLTFVDSVLTEWDFLTELSQRSGCGLLLDVNNIYVSAQNNGFDTGTYLDGIPGDAVGEIHLAGHAIDGSGEDRLLIDTHGDVVADPVWALYQQTLEKLGPRPTLIEWDTNIPELEILLAEAHTAQRHLNAVSVAEDSSRVA